MLNDFRQFQFALARHLRDPLSVPAPEGIDHADLLVCGQDMVAHVSALLDCAFPVTQALLGDALWQHAVRLFLKDAPHHAPWATAVQRAFVEHVCHSPEMQNLPAWLQDLAHFEWLQSAVTTTPVSWPAFDATADLMQHAVVINPTHVEAGYEWPVHDISTDNKPDDMQSTHVSMLRDMNDRLHVFESSVFRTQLLYASPALVLPVLIVVFLRFGVATPTEVAVLSTLYAGVISVLVYKDLGLQRLHRCVIDAGLATGVVLLVIMASAAIGWLLTFDRMPDGVVAWAQENLSSAWSVILMMNVLMLVCGMFIDLPAAVLLLTPVFVPLANAIGMDLVQLGIMMTVNLAIGLYTPPVGTTLFITSSLAKVKVGETVRELGPFYLVAFGVLLLVSYVPALIFK